MKATVLRLISGIEASVAFVLVSAYCAFIISPDDLPYGMGGGMASEGVGVEIIVYVEAEYDHSLVSFEYLLELIGPFVQQIVVHLMVALFLSPRSVVFLEVDTVVVEVVFVDSGPERIVV